MTQRLIETEVWGHPDYQQLSTNAKLLFLYSFTNSHCNAAGLYRITPETIAFETGLQAGKLAALFAELKPLDVEWLNEKKTLWVKKFLKHQTRSPKFLTAVAKSLKQLSDGKLIEAYLKYNHTIPIPSLDRIDTVSQDQNEIRDTGEKREENRSRRTAGEALDQEAEVTPDFLATMKQLFPGVAVDIEWEHCRAWYTKRHKNPSSDRLINWLKKSKSREMPKTAESPKVIRR